MSDMSDIRRSHILKRRSNKMKLFLATKDCFRPWVVAAVEEPIPSGGVRFLKIKYKIGFRNVSGDISNSSKSNGTLDRFIQK